MKHEIEKIKFGVVPIVMYRGCLLEKIIGGYRVFGEKCSTPQQVDDLIDKSLATIKQSIK